MQHSDTLSYQCPWFVHWCLLCITEKGMDMWNESRPRHMIRTHFLVETPQCQHVPRMQQYTVVQIHHVTARSHIHPRPPPSVQPAHIYWWVELTVQQHLATVYRQVSGNDCTARCICVHQRWRACTCLRARHGDPVLLAPETSFGKPARRWYKQFRALASHWVSITHHSIRRGNALDTHLHVKWPPGSETQY